MAIHDLPLRARPGPHRRPRWRAGRGRGPGRRHPPRGAARALDPGADTSYGAGSKTDRHPSGESRSDGEFLEAVSEAEDDVRERLQEVQPLQEQVAAALDAARKALAQARVALGQRWPCP